MSKEDVFNNRVADVTRAACAQASQRGFSGGVELARNVSNDIRLLRFAEVSKRVTLGRSAIYALIAQNGFPKPVKLTPRRSAWVESEVEAWVKARMEGRQ